MTRASERPPSRIYFFSDAVKGSISVQDPRLLIHDFDVTEPLALSPVKVPVMWRSSVNVLPERSFVALEKAPFVIVSVW